MSITTPMKKQRSLLFLKFSEIDFQVEAKTKFFLDLMWTPLCRSCFNLYKYLTNKILYSVLQVCHFKIWNFPIQNLERNGKVTTNECDRAYLLVDVRLTDDYAAGHITTGTYPC